MRSLGGPASWRGHELVEDQRWLRVWPDRCIDAFDHALAHAARAGLEWWQADRSRFPLSAVAEDIAELAHFLERVHGQVGLDRGGKPDGDGPGTRPNHVNGVLKI